MRNFLTLLLIIVFSLGLCLAKDYYDKLDRSIIACRSTDFVCFKRQYRSLRDNVLLGNLRFGLEEFEPYYFKYGNSGTCIKMSGFEESQLAGIGIDSRIRELTLVLELPLKLQQVEDDSNCSIPEQEFKDVGKHQRPSKKFAGNATIQVSYPYNLKKKKGDMYMLLEEEGLDVILDIPGAAEYENGDEQEIIQYELSEWAYEVVQHVNAAEAFALPYTSRLRFFSDRVPLERLLLLYPEERYTDINFHYSESPFFVKSKKTNSTREKQNKSSFYE